MLFAASLIFYSCENNVIDDQNPEETEVVEYSFSKIEFLKTQQSVQSENNISCPAFIFSNGSELTQNYPFDPLSGFYETSQFKGIDPDVIKCIDQSVIVSVPVFVDDVISLGEAKWLLSVDTQKMSPDIDISQVIQIAPYTKMTLNSILTFRKITTPFKLTLANKKTGELHVFEGLWEGVCPVNAEISITYNNL
jgi:hypothetical protein